MKIERQPELPVVTTVSPSDAPISTKPADADKVAHTVAPKPVVGPQGLPFVGTSKITPHTEVSVLAAAPVGKGGTAPAPLNVIYHPGYRPDAGIGEHPMPIDKFRFVAAAVETAGIPVNFIKPAPMPEADIARVHSQQYIDAIKTGSPRGLAEASTFAWSPGLFESVCLTSGGEYAAALEALKSGDFAFAPVSGFHHARPDRGDGFCTFNGLAITAKKLLAEGLVERVLVIDNDFHYGNGTAHACADEPRIFTFSVYGQGWDLRPESKTNRRIELPSGTTIKEYMAANLELERIVADFKPSLILFQAGMDPLQTDSLSRGTFQLSHADLKLRDRWVMSLAKSAGVPIVTNLAGGYSYDKYKEPSPIVVGHLNTYLAALEVFRGYRTDLIVPAHARA